ncbi:MAG: glycoside hydrolase family 9 protein, partial [Anaerolineales bacterium]
MKSLAFKILSFFVIAAFVMTTLAINNAPIIIARAAGIELITNGDFSAGSTGWNAYGGSNISYAGGVFSVDIPVGLGAYSAAINRSDIVLESGVTYTLSFDAWGDGTGLPGIPVMIQENGGSYTQYFNQAVTLTSTSQTFTFTFTPTSSDPAAMFQIALGGLPNASQFTFHLDNVSLTKPAAGIELITNGDFSAGATGWNAYGGSNINYTGGVFSVDIPVGLGAYSAAIIQNNIPLESGVTYTLKFDSWADGTGVSIPVMIQENGGSYTQYFNQAVALTSTPQTFTFTFTPSSSNPAAMFQVALGGLTNTSPFTFHLDNVSLIKPGVPPTSTPTPTATSTPLPGTVFPPHIGELLLNGAFDSGATAPWTSPTGETLAVNQKRLEATIVNGGGTGITDAIVQQGGIPVFNTSGAPAHEYTLTFKAWASADMSIYVSLQKDGAPYTQYYSQPIALTTTPKTFTFAFDSSVDDPAAALQFQIGAGGNNVFYLDNVSLNGPEPVSHMQAGQSIIINGDFSAGFTPWWNGSNTAVSIPGGALQVVVTGTNASTSNPWDASVGQNNISLLQDGNYTLDFDAWADRDVAIQTLIQLNVSPYTAYFKEPAVAITTTQQHYHFAFISSATDPAAGFQFQIGKNDPFTFHVDNVVLLGPTPTPATHFLTGVRLNQTGYLPGAPKIASVVVDVTDPQPWTLYDSGNNPVATGTTTVFGADAASGEIVQQADFSSFTTPGAGYYLEVYGEDSHPFDIGSTVYTSLQYDSLAYFYQTRAGIPIAMPYAGRPDLARPAGHIGVAPNLGDTNVPCFDQTDTLGHKWNGCNYTLDVSKGWYDAGDHGKYVVNGGIAVWTLLNEYERAQYLGGTGTAAFADGAMNIPEKANGVPDILDEARWELEFMLSMQVPSGGLVEGVDLSGMVHHKVHDGAWTGLGLSPDKDPQQRYLYPPSTAATLNMAAVAAQCARIWATIDPAFSARCLTAAETAWTAAVAHPAMYAAANFTGGGAYDDTNVSDEFYWAASELFITTGQQQYKDFITASPDYLSIPSGPANGAVLTESSLNWQKTQALGTISLAVVPNALTPTDVQTAWTNITQVADGYAAAVPTQGYLLPFAPGASGYVWGSNADVMNNMLILGLTYDHTAQAKYLNAISNGMDYILGRNPNDKSYVTGYGEQPLQNPHHRFWAHSLDASFPTPPSGVMAGGPDSSREDTFIQGIFTAGQCAAAPQKCYVDNIQSYSTNEEAINWNASLAWVSAFLDGVAHPYTISGNVGVAGATIHYTDGIARTVNSDSSGNFTIIVSADWTGAITPSKPDYTFSPASINVT